MEYMVLVIILAVSLVLLVIYNMIMIGLMSGQTSKFDNLKKDVSEGRTVVKAKYNIA